MSCACMQEYRMQEALRKPVANVFRYVAIRAQKRRRRPMMTTLSDRKCKHSRKPVRRCLIPRTLRLIWGELESQGMCGDIEATNPVFSRTTRGKLGD